MSKQIRTEVHITIATFIGDDISDEKPPMSRSPDNVEAASIIRVSSLGPTITAHETSKGHVVALLASAASTLGEKVSHHVRNLHIPNQ